MALYYLRETGTIVKERTGTCAVLAPSLYWYARAQFPTRSLKRAKKLADSYLASRPASYTAIHVVRAADGFDCYAYDAAALEKRLAQEGLGKETPCYFLQQFAEQMPLRIDDTLIADALNGICLEIEEGARKLPMLDGLDIEAIAEPFNTTAAGTHLKRPFAAAVALLAVTALFDLGLRYQTLHDAQSRLEALRSGRSIYEIRALVKQYETLQRTQSGLREQIRKALRPPLKGLSCSPQKGCTRESR